MGPARLTPEMRGQLGEPSQVRRNVQNPDLIQVSSCCGVILLWLEGYDQLQ
jgi:hypothetical protein